MRTFCVQSQEGRNIGQAMCGRLTAKLTWQQLHDLYDIPAPGNGSKQDDAELKPRYNVAPTDVMPACRLNRSGQREIAMLKWGLIHCCPTVDL